VVLATSAPFWAWEFYPSGVPVATHVTLDVTPMMSSFEILHAVVAPISVHVMDIELAPSIYGCTVNLLSTNVTRPGAIAKESKECFTRCA